MICVLLVLFCLPSITYAQKGEPVRTWYSVKAGEKAMTVQAKTVLTSWTTLSAKEVEIFIILDGKKSAATGPIEITPLGSDPKPIPYDDASSQTTMHMEGGVFTTSTTTVGGDGTVTTTTKSTDSKSGTETTTTTTTDSEGNTSTTINTEENK